MDNFDLRKYLAEGKLFEEDFKNPILDKYLELKKSIDYKTVFPTDLQSFLDSLDNTEREGLKRDLAEGKLFEEDFKNPILDKYLELKKSIDYKTVFPTDLQSFLDSLDNTEREGLKRDLAEGKILKEAFYPEFEGETNDKINDIAIAVVDELESKIDSESSGILKGMDYYVGSDGMDNDEVEQGFTKWFIDLVKYLSKNNNEVTISSVEQDGKVFTPAITLKYLDNGKEDISWKLK